MSITTALKPLAALRYFLHDIADGRVMRRSNESISFVACGNRLYLTVVNAERVEVTVPIDASTCDDLIAKLPALRASMEPAGECASGNCPSVGGP